MRILLSILLLFSGISCVRAASPSFGSFDQANFTTNGLVIRLRYTNTFGTLIVTNLYVTTNRTEILVAGNTYITNLYVTNLYSTNIVINGTNAASQGDLVWTNVAGVIQPRPNQITNTLLFVSGSADNATNMAAVIDVVETWTDPTSSLLSFRNRGTNVGYVTPYGGYFSGRSTGDINPADSDVFIGVRDISKGEPSTAGLWVGAYDTASNPTNYSFGYISANAGTTGDALTFNLASSDTNEVSIFRVQLSAMAGMGEMELIGRSITNFVVNSYSGYSGTGTNVLLDNGNYGPYVGGSNGTNTTVLQLGPFTPLYLPVANGTNTLTDSPVHIVSTGSTNVIFDGQIIFGSAATNILSREGAHLMYRNSDASRFFITNISSGAYGDVGFGTGQFQLETSLATLALMNSTKSILFNGSLFYPSDASVSLGASGVQWNNLHLTNQIVFGPGTTNVIYRSGTSLVYSNGLNALSITKASGRMALESTHTMDVKAATGFDIRFWTGGAERWEVDPNGHFLGLSGATYNIGIDALGQVGNSPKNIALANYLVINNGHTPASSSETNFIGAICWDDSYLYVWTATNVNKRVALTTW